MNITFYTGWYWSLPYFLYYIFGLHNFITSILSHAISESTFAHFVPEFIESTCAESTYKIYRLLFCFHRESTPHAHNHLHKKAATTLYCIVLNKMETHDESMMSITIPRKFAYWTTYIHAVLVYVQWFYSSGYTL